MVVLSSVLGQIAPESIWLKTWVREMLNMPQSWEGKGVEIEPDEKWGRRAGPEAHIEWNITTLIGRDINLSLWHFISPDLKVTI